MAACDCCGRDKPDVKIRVNLRGLDHHGHSTPKPFHGPLCDDCLAKTSRFGWPEQRWLLHQIVQGAQTGPKPVVKKPQRAIVAPLRRLPVKPVDPRRY
jgi:hypothetical protein